MVPLPKINLSGRDELSIRDWKIGDKFCFGSKIGGGFYFRSKIGDKIGSWSKIGDKFDLGSKIGDWFGFGSKSRDEFCFRSKIVDKICRLGAGPMRVPLSAQPRHWIRDRGSGWPVLGPVPGAGAAGGGPDAGATFRSAKTLQGPGLGVAGGGWGRARCGCPFPLSQDIRSGNMAVGGRCWEL